MAMKQTVVYSARTAQDAHLLRNLLVDEGIEAVVLNAALADGAGVDAIGWSTAARVAVDEADAARARVIAAEFDRGSPALPSSTSHVSQEETTAMLLDVWPTCPACQKRRVTRCPICGTAGSDFPPADTGFSAIAELDATLAAGPETGCGPQGCSSDGCAGDHGSTISEVDDPNRPPETPPSDDDTAETPMLMCTTCDEPFVPQYAGQCEWCGHRFDDGYAVEIDRRAPERFNARMIGVLIGLAVLGGGLMVYFLWIV